MHKYSAPNLAMVAGLMATCWTMAAQATTSVSPTSATLNVSVNSSQQLSGTRSFDVAATQTDSGTFCTKITEVQVIDKAKGVTLGAVVLPRSLCNFNPTDATFNVIPWKDATLIAACDGKPGQTVPLTMIMDTCTISSNLSFSIGTLFGGQHSDCGKADLSATVLVQCAALPTATTSVSGQGTMVTGLSTPPVVSSSTGTTTASTATSTATTQTGNATPTRITPTVSINSSRVGTLGDKPALSAQKVIAFDASVLARLMMTTQAQSMNDVNADYTALSSAHAAYTAASKAFQAKHSACLNTGYTLGQEIEYCAPADSAVTCAEKIVALCDSAELKALNSSRVTVNTTSAKLAKDAQTLSNATATVP
jgi:hypothetical protein